MADVLHGFPFWQLEFDRDGALPDPAALDRLIGDLELQKISDLFVFSHGWNNDHGAARALYDRFFAQVRQVLDANPAKRPDTKLGIAGVFWPSILWPDDAESASMLDVAPQGGGAAAVGGALPLPAAGATLKQIRGELGKVYDADQLKLLDRLTTMLESQTKTHAALMDFRSVLGELLQSELRAPLDAKHPDLAEGSITSLNDASWRELLDTLAGNAPQSQHLAGGGVGMLDPFQKLWTGAKEALRIATYWQMKERAGVVGRSGLGAKVLTRLAAGAPHTRVHLLGHSFGARLVSFSLAGLPAGMEGERSPVKSLFLLQGAFSHFAFADQLPHDHARSGGLKGMSTRVDGPLLTTYSRKDLAVARSYPAASIVNRDDYESAEEQVSRWGGMGFDGAQAVGARVESLGPAGKRYSFEKGRWLNLDGNSVIVHGGLPSGAHSDIAHPHTAWAALTAATVV